LVSEAKSKFTAIPATNGYNRSTIDKNSHFKLSDGSKSNEMTTVAKSTYEHKGNPLQIRSSLDAS